MYPVFRRYCSIDKNLLTNYRFHSNYDNQLKILFLKNFFIYPKFIDEHEELGLIDEITPKMRRMRYEYDHWDNVSTFIFKLLR